VRKQICILSENSQYQRSYQDDHFYNFLSNDDYRKLYNKIVNSCRNYHQSVAKSWFLQELIDEKVIPPYFKVKNKANNTTSDSSVQCSLDWMKVVLNETLTNDNKLLDEVTNN